MLRATPHDGRIFALALPALGTLAVDPLVSLVDTAFVGRLGAASLGALGVDSAVFGMAYFVFNFLAYGTTPLVAREVGRGDRAAAGRIVVQALAAAVVLGVVATVALELLAHPILAAMGATGELRAPALDYLRIRALAMPAVLIATAAHGAFRGYEDTKTPLVVALGLNLVNLVLDPVLIFALGLGVAGAAWATVIAQWAGALWFLGLLFGSRRAELGIPLALPALRELAPFARVGGALTLRTFALLAVLTLASAIATRLGAVAIAAHQVAAQLWLFLALVIDALAVAGQALIASELGAGARDRARAVANRLLELGFGVGILLAVVFALLGPILPRVFSSDHEVLAAVGRIYPFVVVMQPLNALVFIWDGVFLGARDFRFLALAMVGAALVTAALLFAVLPMGLGLAGVWWAMVLLIATRAATLAARHFWPSGPLAAGAR
jgi:MATE family multidrug resistance protein